MNDAAILKDHHPQILIKSTHPIDSNSREQPNSLPRDHCFCFVEAAAERIEERIGADSRPEEGTPVAGTLVVSILVEGIPVAGMRPLGNPEEDNLEAEDYQREADSGCSNS